MPPLGSTFGLVNPFHYGRAFQQRVPLANVAGNAVASYKIGGGYYERIVLVSFKITAAAGGSNRFGRVRYLGPEGTPYADIATQLGVAPSGSSQITLGIGLPSMSTSGLPTTINGLPVPFMQPGDSLEISAFNGAAGDVLSGIRVVTERFSTSPRDFPPGQGPEVSEREFQREQLAHPPVTE